MHGGAPTGLQEHARRMRTPQQSAARDGVDDVPARKNGSNLIIPKCQCHLFSAQFGAALARHFSNRTCMYAAASTIFDSTSMCQSVRRYDSRVVSPMAQRRPQRTLKSRQNLPANRGRGNQAGSESRLRYAAECRVGLTDVRMRLWLAWLYALGENFTETGIDRARRGVAWWTK